MKRLAVAALAFVSFSIAQDQLTIQTQQGPVTGILVTPGVRRFLGIPYAVANRWEAPQQPLIRNITFAATSFGDTCVQQLDAGNLAVLNLTGLGTRHVQESEECLSVNIWTPSSDRKQNTAVMIWIYGGSFEFGTSNTIFYDGQMLVGNNDDVLLVTFNYRTNIFGSPQAPQLTSGPTSQNFGALDVEAAIKWVHTNIGAFGGNPDRITLFGQSAGSALASAYTFAHPTDTIVKGVIQESGSLGGMPLVISSFGRPFNSTPWTQVATAVGCETSSTPSQFTCMKSVPFRTLENAVVSTNNDFVPVQDGITFFTDTSTRSSAGSFLHAPLLVGNTAQDGNIFMLGLVENIHKANINVTALVSQGGDIFTKNAFECPAASTGKDYVKAGVPVWRYSYEAIFPDLSTIPILRAFHASEIPIVFGTYNSSPFGLPPTEVEISLSRYIQGAWVAFACDPQHGLSNYGWPLYNPQTTSLVQLGTSTNQTGVVFVQPNLVDGNCVAAEIGLLIFLIVLAAAGIHP